MIRVYARRRVWVKMDLCDPRGAQPVKHRDVLLTDQIAAYCDLLNVPLGTNQM